MHPLLAIYTGYSYACESTWTGCVPRADSFRFEALDERDEREHFSRSQCGAPYKTKELVRSAVVSGTWVLDSLLLWADDDTILITFGGRRAKIRTWTGDQYLRIVRPSPALGYVSLLLLDSVLSVSVGDTKVPDCNSTRLSPR